MSDPLDNVTGQEGTKSAVIAPIETANLLDGIIGQKHIKRAVRPTIEAVNRGDRYVMRPMLMCGAPGLGKTTIAEAICNSIFGGKKHDPIDCTTTQGDELFLKLLNANAMDKFFLEDLPALPPKDQERLMKFFDVACQRKPKEGGKVNEAKVKIDDKEYDIPQLSFIAATTAPESVLKALRDRMDEYWLRDYSDGEADQMGLLMIHEAGLTADLCAVRSFVAASFNHPRTMRKLAEQLADYPGDPPGNFTEELVREFLADKDIDADGLVHKHHKFLQALFALRQSKVSLERVANMADLPLKEVKIFETMLWKRGLVTPTGQGPVLTKEGIQRVIQRWSKK